MELLLRFAERLGIHFLETDNPEDPNTISNGTEQQQGDDDVIYDESGIPDTGTLYEGLGFDGEIERYQINEVTGEFDKISLEDYKPKRLFDTLQEIEGIWEEDESETLEDLLYSTLSGFWKSICLIP